MDNRAHIVVIGAGVIGLTAALELSKQGHQVTVLARELPGDWAIEYASPRAGAHFRPTPVNNEKDAFENKLMRQSYDKLKALAEQDKTCGVEFVPAVEYFDCDLSQDDKDMFSAWPGFRMLDASELPRSDTIKAGLRYSAWVLNSPVYLSWLKEQAESHGAIFARETLTAVAEAVFVAAKHRNVTSATTVVVNASGIGFGDAACFPSRGQFILLSNAYNKTVNHHCADGNSIVVIPRPLGGGTVIGGTKEPHNWSPHNSTAAIEEILRRVKDLCPDLLHPKSASSNSIAGLQVQEAYVGRRPMRDGGMRLETEAIQLVETAEKGMTTQKRQLHVVHCYGAGPSGYKISWGVATRVSEMISGLLTRQL